MAAGRQSVQLDDAEIAEFLASHMKVQVATLDSTGGPHLTTLYYVLDDDGRIAFWTYASSQKIVNLRRDPRIACLVEDGDEYFDLRGVSIRGRAQLVEDFEGIKAIGRKVATAMAGVADLGAEGDAIVEAQARKRVGVIVEPVKVASWDHGKLTALPGQAKAQ
ncbi:MAG TPA: pyridoxamine 5'-phosphate oxidase family protein [Aeromicrobium sp.]|nr:pyridoxamine 5'-phosphate oxidase family protein [Aeromicrobium sp.]HKY57367.1 pyridoxamine 5'-phosphate oxidase family protein [Aeromicrobium sp.]